VPVTPRSSGPADRVGALCELHDGPLHGRVVWIATDLSGTPPEDLVLPVDHWSEARVSHARYVRVAAPTTAERRSYRSS
jgi:hypothetical protein